MKTPQWITAGVAFCIVLVLFIFGKTLPPKKINIAKPDIAQVSRAFGFDSLLSDAKRHLNNDQVIRLNNLENSLPDRQSGISRGDGKQQQLQVYHQLAHFWGDTAGRFEIYAWYEAEAARLENSEKKLTFAAHLFLDNLQTDEIPERRQWKALQAKDLFERSLLINAINDSSKIGIGACYIYGNISATPMEGIGKIREVVEKDSTNIYAQLTLAKGSIISGQYDKAIIRLETAYRLKPDNLETILLLADLHERMGENKKAGNWYQKSLLYIKRQDIRADIENRIEALNKELKN